MADDCKRSEAICFKGTERMLIYLNRLAAFEDRSLSDFLFNMARQRLYGAIVVYERLKESSTSAHKEYPTEGPL